MKRSVILFGSIFSAALTLYAQPQQQPSIQPTAEEKRQIQSKTDELDAIVQKLKAKHGTQICSPIWKCTDLIRSRAPGYPDQGAFPHTVTRVIDDERRQQFMDEGAHCESDYFLTVTYLPPIETEKINVWMLKGRTGRAPAPASERRS